MINFLKKNFSRIFAHKIISGLVVLIIAAGVGAYFLFFRQTDIAGTSYVTTAAEIGSIAESISGTGQVSASNQVDIKPEASGKATYVGVVKGQSVTAGTLIAQLDNTDAVKAIREAETNLESANLAMEKLLEPEDELSILQAENSLTNAKESKVEAEEDLEKSYTEGFNTVTDAFDDLSDVMTGIYDILYTNGFEDGQSNIDYYKNSVEKYDYAIVGMVNDAKADYQTARNKYDANLKDYKNTSRYSDPDDIEKLINETYETAKYISEAIKNIKLFIDYYEDIATKYGISVSGLMTTHQNSLGSYAATASSQLTGLSSKSEAITSAEKAIVTAERSIEEKTKSLENIMAGADELEIRSQRIAIEQKENALQEAKENLADYYIRAPFDGVIAEVNIQKGETVSSGTTVATIITTQKIAEISLNEIDSAKVEVGQKATLEFDAIDGLSITGEVVEVDILGAVSSGVVSYNVKIGFDVQDDRIKPGMSMSTTIITASKSDILTVPISAIKTATDGSSYVQVLADGQPSNKTIVTGLSNDTTIEIVSGLEEGEEIITKTVAGGSSSSKSSASGSSEEKSSDNNDAMRSMMQLNGSTGGGFQGGPPSR